MSLTASATLPDLLAPPPYFASPKVGPQHPRTWRSKAGALPATNHHISFLLPGPRLQQQFDGHSSRNGSLSLPPVRHAVQRRGPSDHADPLERDRLLEGLVHRQRQRSGAGRSLEALIPPSSNLDERVGRGQDFAAEKHSHTLEIAALKQRCSELEERLAKEEARRVKAEDMLRTSTRTAKCSALAVVATHVDTATDKVTLSVMFSAWRLQASEARSHIDVRQRAFRGALAWATACERAEVARVLAAWRASISSRHQVASLQTKLFAEEACRGEALRIQQSVLEASHMEADARHRESLRRLRAELVQSQTRNANDRALLQSSTFRAAQEVPEDRQLTSLGSSADLLEEAQRFARVTAELLQEQELEDSQIEFALAAAELLREQELDDSLEED